MSMVLKASSDQPEGSPPALTARDVVRLVDGERVPGVDLDDPEVRVLRAGLQTQVARKAFARARSEGFLQLELGYGLYPDPRVAEQLTRVWGIWCARREQPPITLTMSADGTGRVSCDLAAVGQTWTAVGFGAIGRLLESKRSQGAARWSFTTTALTVEGLEAGDAVAMARSVVWLARPRGA
jgi:hypothetical protein